jgi:hypothetical protein
MEPCPREDEIKKNNPTISAVSFMQLRSGQIKNQMNI